MTKYAPRIVDPVYDAVFQSVRKQFTPSSPLIPWTMGRVATAPATPKDKSLGLPFILINTEKVFRTKKDVCEDEEQMQKILQKWLLIGKGYIKSLEDTAIFYRAQICDMDENKIRAVWGYPFEVFVEEARFVYPYLDWLKHRTDDYPLAYSVKTANGGLGYIFDAYEAYKPGYVTMLDWKSFDKRIPPWLIRHAFLIMRDAFDFSTVLSSDDETYKVNPEISEKRWRTMVNYFINTPFHLSSGKRFHKGGGVPSGSGFTNIIDSIINALLTRYIYYHTCGSLPKFDTFMGDDSIIMTDQHPSLEQIGKVAWEWFGMVVNQKKSYVTQNPRNIQFLGYYCEHGFPIRTSDFLIASWIYPEIFREPDPAFTATRAVGQMWSTMKKEWDHKGPRQFQEVVDGDVDNRKPVP